jgi:hypothetical protein
VEFSPSRLDRLRDPLLERDYVRLCSRPVFFRNRTFAALLVGIVFVLVYASATERLSNDRIGRILHITFTWFAALFVWGVAMWEAAVAIPSERATGALTVLLTVPRTPLRLALGFFLSRVCVALTGLLAMLPIDGAAILLGGVSLESFLTSMLLVVCSAAWGAAVGLWAGFGAPTHRHAQGRSFLVCLLLIVLIPVVILLIPAWIEWRRDFQPRMAEDSREIFYWAAGAVFVANPLGALFYFTGTLSGLPLSLGSLVFLIPAGVTVIYSVEAVIRTGRRLASDAETTLLAGTAPGPMALVRRIFRRGARPEAAVQDRVWTRSLWWKEARPPKNLWHRLAMRIAFAGYVLFLGYLFLSKTVRAQFLRPGIPTMFWDIWMSVPLWTLLLGAAISSGTFLAEEREKGSLDLLRAAPFRPADFILARIVATATRVAPLFAITAIFAVLGLATGQIHFGALLAWALGFAPVLCFLPLLSFRLGMAHKTVRAASRRVAIVVGTLVAGWPLATVFLSILFNRFDDEIGSTNMANPLVSVVAPFTFWFRTMFHDTDTDVLRNARIGTVALVLWGFLAWRIWRRLPRALDRAMHDEGEA